MVSSQFSNIVGFLEKLSSGFIDHESLPSGEKRVVQENLNAPRPDTPYISYSLVSMAREGVVRKQALDFASNQHISLIDSFTIRVQVHGQTAFDSMVKANQMTDRLEYEEELRDELGVNISFNELISGPLDTSYLVEGNFNGRATFDLTFNADKPVSYQLDSIESVNITAKYIANSVETSDNINIAPDLGD
jgi:hypothetical protein